MINIFRKNKWRICYVDEIGAPAKVVIISAKTITQAKEQFLKEYSNKTIVTVMMILSAE